MTENNHRTEDQRAAQQRVYLNQDHPDAHIDHPTPDGHLANWRKYHPNVAPILCPKCKGWGGHNLLVNAYRMPDGMADTPENRYKYRHFRASCSQCVGWGYVSSRDDADCIHEPDAGTNTRFNCVTNYRCKKCGKEWSVDSSG